MEEQNGSPANEPDIDETVVMSSTPQISPAPLSAPAKRTGCLRTTLMVLGLFSILIVAAGVFGYRIVKTKFAEMFSSATSPEKIQQWLVESQLDYVVPPPGYKFFSGTNFDLFELKFRLFVLRPEGSQPPKTDLKGGSFYDAANPAYYIVQLAKTTPEIDKQLEKLTVQIKNDSALTASQEKIWVAGTEMAAVIGDAEREGRKFKSILFRFDQRGFLLGVNPVDALSPAPDREMIASLMRVKPDEVSFTPPKPTAMQIAEIIVTGAIMDRKNAVPALANSEGEMAPTIAYLSSAMTSAPAETKIDIVDALGLLARTHADAVPPLINALKDKSARVEAMVALGALGTSAKDAVPILKKIALNAKEPKAVRAEANKALLKIVGRPKAAGVKGKKGKAAVRRRK